jgi:excisionase family DNA binding protein
VVDLKGLTMPRRLVTVREAADHLRVARATVYLLMGRGELEYTRVGRCRRIPWAAVEALVARGTVPARVPATDLPRAR